MPLFRISIAVLACLASVFTAKRIRKSIIFEPSSGGLSSTARCGGRLPCGLLVDDGVGVVYDDGAVENDSVALAFGLWLRNVGSIARMYFFCLRQMRAQTFL